MRTKQIPRTKNKLTDEQNKIKIKSKKVIQKTVKNNSLVNNVKQWTVSVADASSISMDVN